MIISDKFYQNNFLLTPPHFGTRIVLSPNILISYNRNVNEGFHCFLLLKKMSSSTTPAWNKSNEQSKTIKHEQTHDEQHSELSNSSHSTSSSSTPSPPRTAQVNHSQMDSVYSETATMRNLNLLQEHGKRPIERERE